MEPSSHKDVIERMDAVVTSNPMQPGATAKKACPSHACLLRQLTEPLTYFTFPASSGSFLISFAFEGLVLS